MNQHTQTLLATLRDRQKKLNLNNKEFAALLGISAPLWALTRNGDRDIRLQILQGITRVFPDLDHLVLDFLRGDVTVGAETEGIEFSHSVNE